MKILVKAYPNGEVNASILHPKKIKRHHIPDVDPEWSAIRLETFKRIGYGATKEGVEYGRFSPLVAPPLCLSTVAILRKPKGSSGLTRHGRRMIECGTQLLERHCRRDCLTFLTLTLPPSAVQVPNSEGYASAKNRFINWLIRQLRKHGLSDLYVGCVEPHPGRSRDMGWSVPHYHVCYQGRRNGKTWALTPEEVKKAWFRCLVNEGLCSQEGDWSACANVQRVKKSVSRYMGKYMVKTRLSTKQETPENLVKTHPGTWHLISRSLLKLIKQSIKHRSGIAAETILDFLSIKDNPWVLYQGDIEILMENGHKVWVGSYAKVTQECLRYL